MSRQTPDVDIFGLFGPPTTPQTPAQLAVATAQILPTPSLFGPAIAPWAGQGTHHANAQAQHVVVQPPLQLAQMLFGPAPAPTVQPANPFLPVVLNSPSDATPVPLAPNLPALVSTPMRAQQTLLKHFSLPRVVGSVIRGRRLARFTRFRRLPAELRLMIWTLAIPNRVLTVFHKYKKQEDGSRKRMIAVSQPLRTLSFVCYESRQATAKFYKTVDLPYIGWPLTFAPTVDTLYFKTPEPQISNAAFGTQHSSGFGGHKFPSIAEICDDIVEQKLDIPSIMFNSDDARRMCDNINLTCFEEVLVVVGQALTQTRVKVLDPGVLFDGGNGKWGRGTLRELAIRARKLNQLVENLGEIVKDDKDAVMPEIKLVVLCETEVGVPARRCARNAHF